MTREEGPDQFYIDVILSRHARKLLTSYRLRDLAFFAANLEDYQLVSWLKKERYATFVGKYGVCNVKILLGLEKIVLVEDFCSTDFSHVLDHTFHGVPTIFYKCVAAVEDG